LPEPGNPTVPRANQPSLDPQKYRLPYSDPPHPSSYIDWYGDFVKEAEKLGDNTDYPVGHVTWLSKIAKSAVAANKPKSSSTSKIIGPAEIRRKIVVVGDGACGKTCTIIAFSKGTFPEVYVPTVFENYVADVEVDSRFVELALWDTAGQEDYDRLRPLSYPDSHVLMISYAIDSPSSLANVREKWISEVLHFCSGVPIVLAGFKHDLRSDKRVIEELDEYDMKPVSYCQGLMVAKYIGAAAYVECSARMGSGLISLFGTATRLGLGMVRRIDQASRTRHRREGDCVVS
jgi:Ras family protein A